MKEDESGEHRLRMIITRDTKKQQLERPQTTDRVTQLSRDHTHTHPETYKHFLKTFFSLIFFISPTLKHQPVCLFL